jgi:hypothetical protein
MNSGIELLSRLGFVEHDKLVHFGEKDQENKDVLPHVYYASRWGEADGMPLFEYVSLVYHEGKFCESVYEAYIAKKNSRAGKGRDEKPEGQKYSKFEKSGQKGIFYMIYRSFNELETKLTTT